MFMSENAFIGLEIISMRFFFSQGCLFILPFYFGGLEGKGSVYKLFHLIIHSCWNIPEKKTTYLRNGNPAM